ncbi:MAG: 3-deoxy-D-manno-octulosonic acid kinase [Xanthomonadaceae bacterium]|nr:3-deoxy-D-manno-octulosonic acid kinase [Xanthomonadaceae bacterium]MDE2083248.1 3-deoxy-D-manno-octulosonic acid kinase [Xanthomonadaceae bacterium]MDE2256161.1 3-deoxy-D-manno-octulosonic acid kinase [Xanthomonadaceae bacterium]
MRAARLAGMMQAQIQSTPDGAIVFDPDAVAQAHFDPDWFDPEHWRTRVPVQAAAGGRGAALFIDAPFGQCALRHYRRGGMAARVLADRYLWTGPERTRSFAEFRLLQSLRGKGLHVPQPVAARYRRRGAQYRADIITRRIERAATLAQLLAQGGIDSTLAACVGAEIARFHAAGAYHADLNAHNVLQSDAAVWLIDFDRGALRAPARGWQQANLERLKRSLRKLGAARDGEDAFESGLWQALLAAYDKALAT